MLGHAQIHVDLDGLWTLYQYHGISHPVWPDPVYTTALPRFLSIFNDLGVKATFFLIGKDLENGSKFDLAKRIISNGHNIANHSYSHIIPFQNLDKQTISKEISKTQTLLKQLAPEQKFGFRAPGFGMNETIFQELIDQSIAFDSSVFPCPWSGLLRKYEKKKSCGKVPKDGYGGEKYGWAPLYSYNPQLKNLSKKGNSPLLEYPVSVLPFIRLPIHRSFTQFTGLWYFKMALKLLKIRKLPLICLFHGIDLIDILRDEQIPEIKWIKTPFPQRIDEVRIMLKWVKEDFNIT